MPWFMSSTASTCSTAGVSKVVWEALATEVASVVTVVEETVVASAVDVLEAADHDKVLFKRRF